MSKTIPEYHQFLNNIYTNAERMLDQLIGMSYKAKLNV